MNLKMNNWYYFTRLSDGNRRIYLEIYDALSKGNYTASAVVFSQGIDAYNGLAVSNIRDFVINDNPQLFHQPPLKSYYKRQGDAVTITTEPIYTPQQYQVLYQRLSQKASEILRHSQMSGPPERRVRFLYDFLARHSVYNKEVEARYNNGATSSVLNASDDHSVLERYTIVGPLLNRDCVCAGYAKAFQLLCDMAQVSCVLVRGKKGLPDGRRGNHSWNIVILDGCAYHVDVTQASGCFSIGDAAGMKAAYLRRDDYFQQGNYIWKKSFYPTCPKDYSAKPSGLFGKLFKQ